MPAKKQPVNPKRDRFSRLFPDRVGRLIKTLDVLDHCSNKGSYEFDADLVQRCWIEIAKHLKLSAKGFGLDLDIRVNGKDINEIDTASKPKKTTVKKRKKS